MPPYFQARVLALRASFQRALAGVAVGMAVAGGSIGLSAGATRLVGQLELLHNQRSACIPHDLPLIPPAPFGALNAAAGAWALPLLDPHALQPAAGCQLKVITFSAIECRSWSARTSTTS